MITNTLILYRYAGVRDHQAAMRLVKRTLEDLTGSGAVKKVGTVWELNGRVIARELEYDDDFNRVHVLIQFGSVFALAAALKASNTKMREYLMKTASALDNLEEM